jgi:hypothetical protein
MTEKKLDHLTIDVKALENKVNDINNKVSTVDANVVTIKNNLSNVRVDGTSFDQLSYYGGKNLMSQDILSNTYVDPLQLRLTTIENNPLMKFFGALPNHFIREYICSDTADEMMLRMLVLGSKHTVEQIVRETPIEELGKPYKKYLMEEKLRKESETK